MTVQEFQGDAIERAGQLLAHFVATTHPDKRDWVPAVDGAAGLRPILDQLAECIIVNRIFTGILKGEAPPTGNPFEAPRPFTTADEAMAQLIESARALGEAVRAMSDADLEREYATRRGPMKGAAMIELPYRNMQYHGGQVNLFQLLYGDTEFHIPTPPKS